MATVRVVWAGKGLLKRSSATGPLPSTSKTLLTKEGISLAKGTYLLNWVFVGDASDTVSLAVEERTGETWTSLVKTGPHTVPTKWDRVNSDKRRPPGYKDVFFTVSV